MTQPTETLPEGLLKEIWSAYKRIKERMGTHDFRGGNASVYDGKPNLQELPPGNKNLWLNLSQAVRDKERSTFTLDAYVTQWEIWGIVKDQSNDQYGVNPFKGLKIMSQMEKTFRENLSDIDLDGSVDVNEVDNIEHDITRTEDGTLLDMWVLSVDAHLQLTNCRT